jgi:hypothetical protein
MVMRASVQRQVEPTAEAIVAAIASRRRRQTARVASLLLGCFLLAVAAGWSAVSFGGLLLDLPAAVAGLGLSARAPASPLVPIASAGSEQRPEQEREALLEPFDRVVKDTRARIAGLVEAAASMAADAKLIDEVLTSQIRRNEQLDRSLARADAARRTAVAEAERTRADMARRLDAAADAAAQWRADLAGLYKELETKERALATAKSARDAADPRQATSHEAESLGSEAAGAQDALSAAKAEIARLRAANAALEQERASWRTASELAGVPPVERPAGELVMSGPSYARSDGVRADIPPLNGLTLSTESADLFTRIASASRGTVHVVATAAPGTSPVAGRESYSDWLLVHWMAAQRGRSAAVVQVDPSGRVLVERSEP